MEKKNNDRLKAENEREEVFSVLGSILTIMGIVIMAVALDL